MSVDVDLDVMAGGCGLEYGLVIAGEDERNDVWLIAS